MKKSDILNTIFDRIDGWLQYIGVQLLKLPTFHIFSYSITPKVQTAFVFVAGFIMWTMRITNTFAHGWHGDEEAEQLGNTTVTLSGETFISPKEVKTENIANQSYPGVIMSDEYGSIFSSREGIVTKLHVNLWDTVKKWQTVASISTASNSPEIIALLAEKRADIAVSQWQLNASRNVAEYLESQLWWSGNATQNVYDQKLKAIEIGIDTQKQQLQIRINSLKTQIDVKKQIVESNKISTQSVIWLNEEKQQTAEKELQWSIQNAIATMWRIFAKSEIQYQGFDREFNLNIYWWIRDTQKRYVYSELMQKVLYQYSTRDKLSTQERFTLATLTEKTLKAWIDLLWVSITYNDYTTTQLNEDIDALVDAYADKDIWLTTIISKYKELQKELIWSNAVASGGIIQANADLAWLDQEILLLTKEIELLDAEKKKLLAELNSDQSLRVFDLQKMIIESQAEIVKSQAELQANQNAIWAIQSTVKSTIVTAPFGWTISRKNVVVWQSIDVSTPIFDIVWLNSKSDSFVRFEVPVAEFSKLQVWKLLQISLGWDDSAIAWYIQRISQSVNQDTQTVTVEGNFSDKTSPYPLGTNVRVSSQGLDWEFAVEIPHTAIWTDEWWESYVFKKLPNNTIKKWIIEIWFNEWDKTYVNKWLKATDIIVANISAWERKDDMTVEVTEE